MKIKDTGEFGLIDRLNKGLINNPTGVIKGIGDDTAVLKTDPKKVILFTTDMMVEGVHFSLAFSSPEQIGQKALAVNISDIAAMGGLPTNAVISLGVSGDTDVTVIEGIYSGLRQMCSLYQLNVVGGDTVSSKDLIINVALMGEAEENKVVYRSGAKPGDLIYVTGTLGDSAAGLQLLLNQNHFEDISKCFSSLISKHLAPNPRLQESQLLVRSKCLSAMNDISDGLASELHEISQQSKVGFRIYEEKIPLSEETKKLAVTNENSANMNPLDWALYGGEDFELVFTVKSEKHELFQKYIKENELKVQLLGEITPSTAGHILIDKTGQAREIEAKGYNHFRSEELDEA